MINSSELVGEVVGKSDELNRGESRGDRLL